MLELFLPGAKSQFVIQGRKLQPLYSVQQQRGVLGIQITSQEPLKNTVNYHTFYTFKKPHQNHIITSKQ